MDRNELIQRTFPYLLKRLEDAGINATPEVDPQTNGYILTVDTMRFNVENLLSDLSRSDPAQHQERIERCLGNPDRELWLIRRRMGECR